MQKLTQSLWSVFAAFVLIGCGGGSSDNGASAESSYVLMAWNDLGMHCMDADYSVFSILPPYNTLHAQLKRRDGALITSDVVMTYEAVAGDEPSKINTTSMFTEQNDPKTNFWTYVEALFGSALSDDTGLTGTKTASTAAEPMSYNAIHQWWEAEGIPITPIDDNGSKNYYPRVKVVAKDLSGSLLAEAVTVLPVSDEMDCRVCHGSSSGYVAAEPAAGWVNDYDSDKDYKRNILRLHDELHPNAVADNVTALSSAGYAYLAAGLEATYGNGTPILCASCHGSNALPGTGVSGVSFLTQALHGKHADAIDPQSGLTLENSENRAACYRCHPGEQTQCLRGAMGGALDENGTALMNCQSCHGGMNAVGATGRTGWLDQPNCQACHQNGMQYTSAVDSLTGTLREALDNRFATNPDVPSAGYSLYRFSKGHGDLQCESCHGATHAIYPSQEAGDNLLSAAVQGHSGTIGECSACHNPVPMSISGGPHGMHTVGQTWVNAHDEAAESNVASCAYCHGSDYRGTILSKAMDDRSYSTEWGIKTFARGRQIGCYDCHNGPDGD